MKNRLLSTQNQMLSKTQQRFVRNVAKLDAMSPLKVLSRGYAMAQTEEGTLVRSVKQTAPGEKIVVSLGDGKLNTTVVSIKEADHEGEEQNL